MLRQLFGFTATKGFPRLISSCRHSISTSTEWNSTETAADQKVESKRLAEFRKKLKETEEMDMVYEHPVKEDDPLPPWPNNTNPYTGEIGGPKGLEPTRYGDWERNGRVSDF